MARLRKEKGQSYSQSKTQHDSKQTSTKSKAKSTGLSKDHILSLGGNEEDFDLLKNVDTNQNAGSGSGNVDPALKKDISKFLSDLNLKGDKSREKNETTGAKAKGKSKEEVPKTKGKGKEKEKSKQDKPSTKPTSEKTSSTTTRHSKTKAKPETETPASSAAASTAATTRVDDQPKVQLPTKVTLNPKSNFVFQPTSQWYNALPPLASTSTSNTSITPTHLSSLSQKATELHESDIRTFQTSSSANSSSSEASFLAKIIQSGTLSDRLSALTLLVQSSPLHNIKALETLKTMAERGKGKGGREESLKALRCIVDWWGGGGAPNRKLKYFRDQPLAHPDVTDEYLLLWHFEDWLKKYFFSVLQILETLSLDPLPYIRTQTINLIFTLLRDKPEQEQNLLRLLVNKLGDTEKSLASRASYHLLQLLQTHPAMKSVIVREIISLVLRPPAPTAAAVVAAASTAAPANKHIRFSDAEPSSKPPPPKKPSEKDKEKKNINTHARYYATVTFNQIVLTPGDREVALQLIDVYFEMFKELLGEGAIEDDDESPNNAENSSKEKEEFKTDKKGRILDGGKKVGKGKGKQMEVKGAAGFTEVEDSNSKLVSAILTGVNRALPFAKIDAGDAGINKHIDTLFLITHKSTFNISLQALVLIQQITVSLQSSSSTSSSSSSAISTAKSITDRYYRTLYASLHDNRLATSSKQAMYLNLFFKSVKADAGAESSSVIGTGTGDGNDTGERERKERVEALIRRFVQVLVSGTGGGGATEFIAGGLFLLGELFSSIPGLRAMVNEKPKKTGPKDAYDPRKREPQYAHASSSPLWELTPLLNHYHPAVSLHAKQLLLSQPLTASADLSQNTIMHFLDRFVYKNAKKVKDGEAAGGKGPSAMQPAASALEGVKLVKGEHGLGEGRVNEKEFLRKKASDVPVDQIFFHQYFTRKEERERAKAAKIGRRKDGGDNEDEEDEDEDEEDQEDEDEDEDEDEEKDQDQDQVADEAASEFDEEDSDADEDEIWKVMQATMPKAAGDDDDLMQDSDLDEEDESVDFGDDESLNADFDDDKEVEEEEEEENSDNEEGLSLAEDSDNEDLIPLDSDMPHGLIEYDGSDRSDGEEGVWGGITTDKKRKRKDDESKGGNRKKLRSLPTFASYEDYKKLIEEGPEDDI